MSHPVHPASERSAAVFHSWLASIGLAHVIGGIAMIWFHLIAAKKHWDDR